MKTNFDLLINLCWLLLVVTLFIFLLPSFEKNKEVKEEVIQPFCAVIGPNYSGVERNGKRLFKIHCAACHNKSMKDDMTGPALSGFLKRWNYDTIKVYQYLSNPSDFTKTTDINSLIEVKNKFSPIYKEPIPLSYKNVRAIVEYIESF